MADIINLNKVRKQKARQAAATQADANRLKFGRTREQKAFEAAQEAEARARLDALHRQTDDPPAPKTQANPEEA